MLKGKNMLSLISSSHYIQDALHIILWLMFFSLAVAVHNAKSEEGTFASEKPTLATKSISSDIRRQLPYRFDTNLALNRPVNDISAGTRSSNTPKLSFFSAPKNEDGWSVNIQKEAPTSSNCATSSTTCFDSKDVQPNEIKPQQESYWFVLRKAFHF
jgi:hypothetical protein